MRYWSTPPALKACSTSFGGRATGRRPGVENGAGQMIVPAACHSRASENLEPRWSRILHFRGHGKRWAIFSRSPARGGIRVSAGRARRADWRPAAKLFVEERGESRSRSNRRIKGESSRDGCDALKLLGRQFAALGQDAVERLPEVRAGERFSERLLLGGFPRHRCL
jgi:hypothetical protein